MRELEVIKFIKNHPDNFRELLSSSPYSLLMDENEDYILLKYSQIDSDFNQPICQECRGLIIDKYTFEPKALSFFKFFNYQEQFASPIDWSSARVQEKVDGSKILVWHDKGQWHISTSGKIDAREAEVNGYDLSFYELFVKAVCNIKPNCSLDKFFAILNPLKCYTFELVSPYNRIVVPYKETKIYLIGMRDTDSFEEEDPCLELISRPKSYSLNSLQACIDATNLMGYDEEGFVVVDKYWRRIKIKSPQYLACHYLKSNGVYSKERILDIVMENEQEEVLSYFPEFEEMFNEVERSYNNWLEGAISAINDLNNHRFETRKDLALFVMSNYREYSTLLFNYADNKDDDAVDSFIKRWLSQQSSSFKKKVAGE